MASWLGAAPSAERLTPAGPGSCGPWICASCRPLAGKGVSVEVIDRRTPKPFDDATIVASARQTGRVVVAHEASRTCGMGGEMAATVAEKAFASFNAPVLLLSGPEAPTPARFPLEQAFVLPADAIVGGVQRMLQQAREAVPA